MKVTALILAGGRGERFWPRSRKSSPKQFLCLTGDGKTMIRHTVDRISSLVEAEDIFISTNADYKALVREQLPEIPEENILCEPIGRNTAPGIGLGAVHVRKKYEDALMLVLPSDHLIKMQDIYRGVLKEALEVAEEGKNLVTLGITPTSPETGYGYIRFKPDTKRGNAYAVDRFVEKPDAVKAKEYVDSGEYLWNSGMFIWKVSSILDCMERDLPEIYAGLTKIEAAIGTAQQEQVLRAEFETMPSESVDYGILEKESGIFVLPGAFGWDDVGSWLALERLREADGEGNVLGGNTLAVNAKGCIVEGQEKLMALVGVEDLVIVDTGDATLICSKNSTADIKKLLERLRADKREEYL